MTSTLVPAQQLPQFYPQSARILVNNILDFVYNIMAFFTGQNRSPRGLQVSAL
jgi:hypothetical protein